MAIEKSPLAEALAGHMKALKRQSVEVPELKDFGFGDRIYFDPLTMEERDRLMAIKDDGEMLVDAVILKAMDQDGKKLLRATDKPMLQKAAAPAIIARIGNRILAADRVDVASLGES